MTPSIYQRYSDIYGTFAVTGEIHGSIVVAVSKDHARKIFESHYKGEKILLVKDLKYSRTYNL